MYSNLLGEFVGTMVLCAFGNTVVANLVLKDTKGNGAGWVHVNWGWSFGLMMGIFAAWAFGAPQADLNPAVTLFKALGGVYTIPQTIATCIAEVAGGTAGGIVAYFTYLNHWEATEDPGLKLAVFYHAREAEPRRQLPHRGPGDLLPHRRHHGDRQQSL